MNYRRELKKIKNQKMNNLQKLQQHVVELASHVDQLHEVIFTDLDGVPILRCSIDSSAEMSIKTHFLASKALSAEKVRTLTIGDLKSAVFYYSQYQLVLIRFNTMFLCLIASTYANTSELLALRDSFNSFVCIFQKILGDSTLL
ncbi:Ragulator complex protein LAMTOR3 [Trichinella pseudospiralis]|uniref:Ragulator complex protein LAMTOR3 n=1 Tax=Trichinella pseudospiralis TaxID=6337 RepID=A0A0V1GRF5_TRIPS|nr:Ragulator complex protein LAMTOR3 [Trichinella pseudospiralis]